MKIKAAVLVESHKPLEIAELETPVLRFGQVLVRVLYSGICGAQVNEIEAVKGPDKFLPHLLGHEGCGEVLEVGEGVKSVKVGDRVVMHWRPGKGLQCEPPVYKWGTKTVNAGWVTTFNDHAVVSENRVTPIPKDFDPRIAPLFGCAITTAFGVVNNDAQVRVGESVLVIGVGGVGLPIVKALSMVSAYPIVAVDLVDSKMEMAEALGATRTTLPAYDVVIETTGITENIEDAYKLTKPKGRTILVGVPSAPVELYTLPLHFKKILKGSEGGDCKPDIDIPNYIRMMKAGKLSLDGFVTHEYGLEDINIAIQVMRSGQAGRVMVRM